MIRLVSERPLGDGLWEVVLDDLVECVRLYQTVQVAEASDPVEGFLSNGKPYYVVDEESFSHILP